QQRPSCSRNIAYLGCVMIDTCPHRFSLVPGDPATEVTERRLTQRPPIAVPTIVLHGGDNGVTPVASSERHHRFFTAAYERRVIPLAGHNLPQEAPQDFSAAVLSLVNRAKEELRSA